MSNMAVLVKLAINVVFFRPALGDAIGNLPITLLVRNLSSNHEREFPTVSPSMGDRNVTIYMRMRTIDFMNA